MKAIIAGGGTGGHLFPGIAVAREIQRRDSRSEVLFVGAEQGIEARIVPKEGFPLRTLPLGGIKGVGMVRRIKNLLAMVGGLFKAQGILRDFKPDVVIGVGGYASFPMLSAAIMSGYPRVIMEQNAIPGLANRVLGRWVDFAAVTDPGTQSHFGDRAVVTGNPVRPEFKSIPPKEHVAPYTILIFGGSQGAQSINKAVIEASGRAAILIPFPFATDDHQTKNARAMADEKAAVLIPNAELNGKRLADVIRELMEDPARLKEIESNARRIAILDAEQRIVNLVETAIDRHA